MRSRYKNKPLNKLGKTILIFNCFAVVALFICYTAPYINPDNFWPPAFFSMAYVPILFTNAVFLVFWMIRMRIFALVSAIGILLGSGLMLYNIGFHKQLFETTKASPGLIRVMTYNVYDFLNESPYIKESTNDQILGIITEQQPDILNIQEFFTHNQDKYVTVDSIKKALNTKYYWFKCFKITPYDSTGLAVFSKYPIINRDTIPKMNGIKTEGIYVDVQKEGKIIRVYNFHLQSTNFDRDENAYIAEKGKPKLDKTKHIGGKLKLAFMVRGQQVIGLKQLLDKCPYPYIITGDLNDTPLSFAVNYLGKGLKNAFRERGYGLGVTWYGQFPGFQLDHILVSPQFDVSNYKIIRQRLSDHYPVLSDVELK